jgi:hypothetical protein
MNIDRIDDSSLLTPRERGLAAWRALIEQPYNTLPAERVIGAAPGADAQAIVAALPPPVLALQRHAMAPAAGQLVLAVRAAQDDGTDLVSSSLQPDAGSASAPSDASAQPGQPAASILTGDVRDGQASDPLGSRVFDALVRRR